jgi:hypothetical protein
MDDFLFGFLGLQMPEAVDGYLMHYPRRRKWESVDCGFDAECLFCASGRVSSYALGDRGTLPCKSVE